MSDSSRAAAEEEEEEGQAICPDCKGTGVYIGFMKTEPCSTCQIDPLEWTFQPTDRFDQSNHVFEIDDGGTHWYSGNTIDEVLELYKKDIGEELDEDILISQVDDDKEIGVINPDNNKITVKLAKDWAADGKGFVATTEY